MVRQHQIELALAGADDDCARRLTAVERDRFALNWSGDRLQLRIESIGETGRRSGAQNKTRPDGGADQMAAHEFPLETINN